MTDMLLEFAQSAIGRKLASNIQLPIPMPERLERPEDPAQERFLEGKAALAGGQGEMAAVIAEVLCRAGAATTTAGAEVTEAFGGPAQAYGRSVSPAGDDPTAEGPFDAVVFDATGFTTPADLGELHSLFQPFARRLGRSAHVVLLARPPQEAANAAQAAASQALEGFTRSLAKEIGGMGSVANLLWVETGAEKRAASALRFFLSGSSAFVTAQPLRISKLAKWDDADPWVAPLDGKVALVTGAARGIGAATAAVLAAEGAHVVCLDRPAEDEPLSQTARAVGGSALTGDVTEPDTPARIAEALAERGGLDILVHNAGVTRDRLLKNMDRGRWDQAIDINLEAIVGITGKLVDSGTLQDGGRVISLASIAGIAGNMGQTNYAASKAGVIGFTRHLAAELAPRGITVNAVAPGFIETKMTAAVPAVVRQAGRRLSALGQGGLPEDVARTITFLAKPGSAGVTGNVLRICGGALLGA